LKKGGEPYLAALLTGILDVHCSLLCSRTRWVPLLFVCE